MRHEKRLEKLVDFFTLSENVYMLNQLTILKEEIKYDLLKEKVDQTTKISELFKTK